MVDSLPGRLIVRKLFILFLLLWGGAASAETVWYHYNYPNDTFSSSAGGSCALGVAKSSGSTFTGASPAGNGAYNCNCSWKAYPGAPDTYGTCGQALSTTKPDCSSGQVRQPDGSCGQPPCTTPAGESVSWTHKAGHSKDPNSGVSDGSGGVPTSSPSCGIDTGTRTVEDCWAEPTSDGGFDAICRYSAKSNGQQAPVGTPGGPPAKPDGAKPTNVPPTKSDSGGCPGGTTQGGVAADGMAICIGSGTNPTNASGGARGDASPTASTTTKSTDASGNKVTTTTGTRDNGDGSKTVTKTVETEAPDGSKSSTTTTTTGLTPGGKQGQPDKPDTDFCRLHPELNICRNSSIAGQCGQITCMGDAIQCATLREAATIQCRQKDAEDVLKASPEHALGSAASNGNDPLKDSLPSPGNAAVVDIPTLNADGWLGGGGPIDDVSFVFLGQTIVIPFSKAAAALIVFRYALMVAASLISFRILSGAILAR